jgi:hypothetical protein
MPMARRYGTPDDETPELDAGDATRARAWRPGDPVGIDQGAGDVTARLRPATGETARLRRALEDIVRAHDAGAPLDAAIRDARAALAAVR